MAMPFDVAGFLMDLLRVAFGLMVVGAVLFALFVVWVFLRDFATRLLLRVRSRMKRGG